MSTEQAKSELMQIYGMLSEEKKQALDVAIKALQEQADRNEFYNWDSPIRKQAEEEKNCDNCGKLKYHCQECGVNLDNWTPKQTDKIKAQADEEYISKEKAIIQLSWDLSEVELPRIKESLDKLPSVDIPPDHDGCKDCVYQDNPQDAMPCRECKQNYMDMWKAKANKVGHWIMPQQDDGMSDPIYYQVRCSKCGFDLDPQTWHQELHQYDADNFCPKCGCLMEIER